MVVTAISEQFREMDIIGRGSFGLIRRVSHKSTGKIYVRKEISYQSLSKKEEKQLSSEFQILENLDHPNIVHVYAFDKIPNEKLLHIYMEYCDGGDLSQIIKKYRENNEYIPETLIWQIFTQTLLALYRCHYGIDIQPVNLLFKSTPELKPPTTSNSSVVIHRDIKPENIFFLSDQYTVKLGDFGLAKSLGPDTFTQTYVGTPYYMPPEVIAEDSYDQNCDIWSLGCVMYELCALTPPFTAKTQKQLQEKILSGLYNELPSHYSNRLKMCIYACLIVEPKERADANLLLQETSFKIFRREWELNQKELSLTIRGKEIKHKEQQLSIFKDELISKEKQIVKIENSLEEERKKLINQNDEYMRQLKAEFKNALESNLNKILSDLPPEVRIMLQPKSKENRAPQNYYPSSPNKLKGARSYDSDLSNVRYTKRND